MLQSQYREREREREENLEIGIEGGASDASDAKIRLRLRGLAESENFVSNGLGGVAVVPELAQPPILRHQGHLLLLLLGLSIDRRSVLLRQELFQGRQGFRAQRRRIVVFVVHNDAVLGAGYGIVL